MNKMTNDQAVGKASLRKKRILKNMNLKGMETNL